MNTERAIFARLLPVFALAAAALPLLPWTPAQASSHREAPFITELPKVDGTDFYMFRSYEPGRSDFVTIIANYLPLQDAYGGPNYFFLDPDALYEIHVDNDGDAREDITFQFRFENLLKDFQLNVGGTLVSIPLIQKGAISAVNDANLNIRETYTVNIVRGDRRTGASAPITNADTGSAVFDKPVDNIGTKTIPIYAAYAGQHIHNINIPGCGAGRMFVGQRKEPFVVNLGETFDLLNIAIIGGWTTASVRRVRLLNRGLGNDRAAVSKEVDGWAQVSRLGLPLVNEVVIGLKDKNEFNASEPKNDGQFAIYVTHPTLPELIEILFGAAGVQAPNNFPRNDLVTALLKGIPGLNQPTGVVPSEMLRLNTGIPPAAAASQNRLGVIGGDIAGFPNGRRPGDDVVDIELRVLMGKLCTLGLPPTVFGCTAADAPSGGVGFTDGAFVDASFFDAVFPYLKTPIPGSPNGVSD